MPIATNRNIEDDIAKGHFCEDLFFRLNVLELRVPACGPRPSWPWPATSSCSSPESSPARAAAFGRGRDCSLEEIEREQIVRVVQRAPSLERAAEILAIDTATLWRKRKRYE